MANADSNPVDPIPATPKDGRKVAAAHWELSYDDVKRLCASRLRAQLANHTLRPTVLANEVFVRMSRDDPSRTLARTQFMAHVSMHIRRFLIDYFRKRDADKRGGGAKRIEGDLETFVDLSPDCRVEILHLDKALNRLAALDPRQAEIVQHFVFGGLTHKEIAEHLGVSVSTVGQQWRFARAWLASEIDHPSRPG